jgi:3-isopropylmalate dehydrogenase
VRIERRLRQPRWLLVAVPACSLVFAFFASGIVLLATGHDALSSYRLIVDAAFLNRGALGQTLISATPLAFTGLAAAAAFRMRLFNIGGEGQLYIGAITASAAGLYFGGKGGPSAFVIAAMVVAGCAGGAAWGLIPGILRAFFKTNEIITSLMLNYVAANVLTYLIFNTKSYWRETKGVNATVFPTAKTLPDSALKELAAHDAILFGAVGVDPRGSAQIPQGILETEILLKMRFELDQYINLRPTKLLPGVPTPLKNVGPGDIDMIIVRENTEGLYAGNGGFLYKGTPHEVANQIEVTTRHGVERAIRYAFEYAVKFGRKKVTLVAKTNVLRFAHNLWIRAFEEVKAEYPNIQTDYHHVDACTMYMVTKPSIYDVIVTTNMFGDIITDLGAAIQGGMGMAASGNLNPTRQAASMFEPVHGSAPDIAGKGYANPIATFLSVAMMLDFLGQEKAALAIQKACQDVVADPKNHTRDLGGTMGTAQVGEAVCAKLGS